MTTERMSATTTDRTTDQVRIAESVTGLIGLSNEIITTLNNLYILGQSAKNAPESIVQVMAEMNEMKGIFLQVQPLVTGNGKKPKQDRLKMISVHNLMAILSGCVLVFSKLDKHLSEVLDVTEPSAKASTAGKFGCGKVRWEAWKESDISDVLGDLQEHKRCLNLMLYIIQCKSSSEAKESVVQLQEAMEPIILNETSVQNIQPTEAQYGSSEIPAGNLANVPTAQETRLWLPEHDSGPTPRENTSTSRTAGCWSRPQYDKDDTASMKSTDTTFSRRSIRSVVPSLEDTLQNSRAYKRVLRRGGDVDSVFSVDSSQKGEAWSMLSDISLGELSISDLANLELPICLSDLWDPEPYRIAAAAAPVSTPHKSSARFKWSSRGRIHNAIVSGNEYVVRTLLALGSDIEELDGKGRTPIAHAFIRNQFSIVTQLLEKGASTEPLRAIATPSDLQDKLKRAIDSGNEEVVRLLLDMGMAFDDRIPASPHDMSPLLYAAYKGKLSVVKLLLKKGADIQARDNEGWTVLHCAADSEDAELVQYLLDNGALDLLDITATSNTPGDTPLHVAASHNRLPVAKILVERGAHVNEVNKAGNTPYQKARERSPSVAKYLWSQLQPAEQAVEKPPRH